MKTKELIEILQDADPSGECHVRLLSGDMDGDKCGFYELGSYVTLKRYKDENGNLCEDREWVIEGIFKEIDNVNEFLKRNKRMLEKEYIKHHNFVIAI